MKDTKESTVNVQAAVPDEAPPGSIYWPLFQHMSQEFGLSLTDSEMADLVIAVDRMRAGWKSGAPAIDQQQVCSLSSLESTLINIAAEMLRPGVFISAFAEDHPKRTPKRVIKAAERQREQLQEWASKIASTARSLRNDQTKP